MNQRLLQLITLILSAGGIFTAGVLTYAHYKGIVPPCGISSSGCQTVQNHPSSVWFGVLPVAALGLVSYLALFAMTMLRNNAHGDLSGVLLKLSFYLSALGSAISLGLQVYSFGVIKAQCNWCLASATLMCALFVVLALQLQKSASESPADAQVSKRATQTQLALGAVLLLASLIPIPAVANRGSKGGQVLATSNLGTEDPLEALTKGGHSLGPENAPITIIEFADLMCPSCRLSHKFMQKIQSENHTTIRWVFHIFPLVDAEDKPMTLAASVVAELADKKGKFWDFVSQMYQTEHDAMKTVEDVYNVAASANLNRDEVEEVLKADDSDELRRVQRSINLAGRVGIQETPTFIVFVPGDKPKAMRQGDLAKLLDEPRIRKILNP